MSKPRARGRKAEPGTVVELSEACAWKAQFFRQVAEAAQSWDGFDPIRHV